MQQGRPSSHGKQMHGGGQELRLTPTPTGATYFRGQEDCPDARGAKRKAEVRQGFVSLCLNRRKPQRAVKSLMTPFEGRD